MGDRKTSIEVYDLTVRRNLTLAGETMGGTNEWLPLTNLSGQVVPNTSVFPSSRRQFGLIVLRGQLAWTAQTIAAATVLAVLPEAHWLKSPKVLDVRTGPTSNVSTQLVIATNGQITNISGLGTTTTAILSFDGKFFDPA
jgi:hypothetical protein